MTAAVYREAYEAGVAAFGARVPSSENPYAVQLSAIQVARDAQPPVRGRVLAAQWLAGWRSARPSVALPPD